ncbi:MAG: protease complex subunit PrcB family protein [Dysgonamonadaceae bacterium]|jgi:hypothetical protein|nr:protease complex subunit PrcB family protein [Dysgonamonadaceae bacterium]
MKTLKNLLFILMSIAAYTGCSENQSNSENSSPAGTKWKLTGFVNGADGTIKTPDTFFCGVNGCYWVYFKEDKTIEGHSASNLLLGNYEVNPDASEIQIKVGAATEVMERPDGFTFIDRLNSVRSFEYKESALLLYYNETDYLLFTVYPVEIEPVLIGKGELHPAEFTEPNRVINRIITSAEEWNELKTTLREKVNTLTETDVDFSTYQVIAIFDEIRSSGGWSIDITGIVEYSDSIVVNVSNLKTGGIASVLTQPYHIVRIPASDKKIVFQKEDDGYNGEPKEVSLLKAGIYLYSLIADGQEVDTKRMILTK